MILEPIKSWVYTWIYRYYTPKQLLSQPALLTLPANEDKVLGFIEAFIARLITLDDGVDRVGRANGESQAVTLAHLGASWSHIILGAAFFVAGASTTGVMGEWKYREEGRLWRLARTMLLLRLPGRLRSGRSSDVIDGGLRGYCLQIWGHLNKDLTPILMAGEDGGGPA